MLTIKVSGREYLDEKTSTIMTTPDYTLQLEHSLISISKWESKWLKPYLDGNKKTDAEVLDYVKCMTINSNIPSYVYLALSGEDIKKIANYIKSPMTATKINRRNKKQRPGPKQIITSEVIYYQMIALNIPIECEKWHLNRLLTLIEVCSIKNNPGKKMSKHDLAVQNRELNAARRARFNSTG